MPAQAYIWTTKYEHNPEKSNPHRAYVFLKSSGPGFKLYYPNINFINQPFERFRWVKPKERPKNVFLTNNMKNTLSRYYNNLRFKPENMYIMANNIIKVRQHHQTHGRQNLEASHQPYINLWTTIRNIAKSKVHTNIVKKPYNKRNFPITLNALVKMKTNIPNYGRNNTKKPHLGRGFQFYNSSNTKHNNFKRFTTLYTTLQTL